MNGVYRSVDYSDGYDITIDIEEKEKTYIFHLIKNTSRFSRGHFEMMFKKSNRVIVKKEKGSHAIKDWNDGTFTIYPYRLGFPYLFKKIS